MHTVGVNIYKNYTEREERGMWCDAFNRWQDAWVLKHCPHRQTAGGCAICKFNKRRKIILRIDTKR
jgi:hypothetical protein